MKVIYGDLMDYADKGIIAHQVNCMGAMGSGVAKCVRNRFPKAYNYYISLCRYANDSYDLLGTCHVVNCNNYKVANLFAQHGYGYVGVHTNYTALESSFSKLCEYARTHNDIIYIPYKMSCDRGGGDWTRVSSMLDSISMYYGVELIAVKLN